MVIPNISKYASLSIPKCSLLTNIFIFLNCISEYVKRVIVHPAFKNISFKDAERLLAEVDQGECIVRPSSKVNKLATINSTQREAVA